MSINNDSTSIMACLNRLLGQKYPKKPQTEHFEGPEPPRKGLRNFNFPSKGRRKVQSDAQSHSYPDMNDLGYIFRPKHGKI